MDPREICIIIIMHAPGLRPRHILSLWELHALSLYKPLNRHQKYWGIYQLHDLTAMQRGRWICPLTHEIICFAQEGHVLQLTWLLHSVNPTPKFQISHIVIGNGRWAWANSEWPTSCLSTMVHVCIFKWQMGKVKKNLSGQQEAHKTLAKKSQK